MTSPAPNSMPAKVHAGEHGAAIQFTVLSDLASTTEAPEATTDDPSPTMKRRMQTIENVQFAMLFLALFSAGFFDGSTGPLLPRIQKVYDVCAKSNCR